VATDIARSANRILFTIERPSFCHQVTKGTKEHEALWCDFVSSSLRGKAVTGIR